MISFQLETVSLSSKWLSECGGYATSVKPHCGSCAVLCASHLVIIDSASIFIKSPELNDQLARSSDILLDIPILKEVSSST
jgi:hypothetical protein